MDAFQGIFEELIGGFIQQILDLLTGFLTDLFGGGTTPPPAAE